MQKRPVVPGPPILGAGVVLQHGDSVPEAWAGADVVQVTESVLAEPGPVVTALHHAWVARRPVVVVLAVDPVRFREPMSVVEEPWRLDARFEVWLDRLHFLVWANNYDARGGKPGDVVVVAQGQEGRRSDITDGRCGDVLLPDGTAAWIDGGPRGPFERAALGAAVVHAETVELGRLVPAPEPVLVTSVLAPDQLAAVSHGAGPARIIAPAGSGKTRVLTERLRHLMLDRGFERENVVAVAYNKKAQLEMQQRTADFRPRVSTLNSLGYQLLRRHAGRAPRVLEEREVRRLLEELLPSMPHRANVDRLAPYLECARRSSPGTAESPRSWKSSASTYPAWPTSSCLTAAPGRPGTPWTSTSRSTAPSRCCCATDRSVVACRPDAVICWWTNSRT